MGVVVEQVLNKLKKLLCRIGIHKWYNITNLLYVPQNRVCLRCELVDDGYDRYNDKRAKESFEAKKDTKKHKNYIKTIRGEICGMK